MVATAAHRVDPVRSARPQDDRFPAAVPIEPPDRVVDRLGGHHPAWAAVLFMAVGYVVLAATVTVMGLVLTHGPLVRPIRVLDRWISEWFADQRTPTLNEITSYLGLLADTTTVIAIAFVTVVILAIRRSWPRAGLLAVALTVEVTVFLTAAALVARDRPDIRQLDAVPPTSSFPSGHTAAAITLYVGLALIFSPSVRNEAVRVAMWIGALLIPLVVALSRLYRGMHAQTDVIAGVMVGVVALLIAILAVRAAEAIADRRRGVQRPTTAEREPVR
jgi:membrane-associated phospholipid phosphatase